MRVARDEEDLAVPIRAALTRPQLVMGCDRRLLGLVLVLGALPVVLGLQSLRIDWVGLGLFGTSMGVGLLIRAGKEDPQLPSVWLRSQRYPRRMPAVGRWDQRGRVDGRPS